jgi:hypothetical protein
VKSFSTNPSLTPKKYRLSEGTLDVAVWGCRRARMAGRGRQGSAGLKLRALAAGLMNVVVLILVLVVGAASGVPGPSACMLGG